MARYRYQQRLNPWAASVQLEGKVYWLGSYPSRYLAVRAEDIFKAKLRTIQGEAYQLWQEKLQQGTQTALSSTTPATTTSTPLELSA